MSRLADTLTKQKEKLSADWFGEQSSRGVRSAVIRDTELRAQSEEFLALFTDALRTGTDVKAPSWTALRDMLTSLSRTRSLQGFTPAETVHFIMSLKKPLITQLQAQLGSDKSALLDEVQTVHDVIDQLALHITEAHQKSREEVIRRQQQEMLELSTPVVKLWDGVLALPLIGTLDSQRTSVVMETLLQRIVDTSSEVAIIDITGVPTVDTLVAQHLLKTVAAARLMGAECIVSGIRPQIAQTIVHLGVDLSSIVTKSSLADAFAVALRRLGLQMAAKAS
jgi:rsbT co-antagonist protein RsbR